ncbi:uncharacterized protein LOC141909648 [Tubulanus polymorphus]|uniref:uncharacterized protein LOC141909648 n=1 Tax=Tubulanus polymorphus TaxID=672921 RepID=UPI003DA4A434
MYGTHPAEVVTPALQSTPEYEVYGTHAVPPALQKASTPEYEVYGTHAVPPALQKASTPEYEVYSTQAVPPALQKASTPEYEVYGTQAAPPALQKASTPEYEVFGTHAPRLIELQPGMKPTAASYVLHDMSTLNSLSSELSSVASTPIDGSSSTTASDTLLFNNDVSAVTNNEYMSSLGSYLTDVIQVTMKQKETIDNLTARTTNAFDNHMPEYMELCRRNDELNSTFEDDKHVPEIPSSSSSRATKWMNFDGVVSDVVAAAVARNDEKIFERVLRKRWHRENWMKYNRKTGLEPVAVGPDSRPVGPVGGPESASCESCRAVEAARHYDKLAWDTVYLVKCENRSKTIEDIPSGVRYFARRLKRSKSVENIHMRWVGMTDKCSRCQNGGKPVAVVTRPDNASQLKPWSTLDHVLNSVVCNPEKAIKNLPENRVKRHLEAVLQRVIKDDSLTVNMAEINRDLKGDPLMIEFHRERRLKRKLRKQKQTVKRLQQQQSVVTAPTATAQRRYPTQDYDVFMNSACVATTTEHGFRLPSVAELLQPMATIQSQNNQGSLPPISALRSSLESSPDHQGALPPPVVYSPGYYGNWYGYDHSPHSALLSPSDLVTSTSAPLPTTVLDMTDVVTAPTQQSEQTDLTLKRKRSPNEELAPISDVMRNCYSVPSVDQIVIGDNKTRHNNNNNNMAAAAGVRGKIPSTVPSVSTQHINYTPEPAAAAAAAAVNVNQEYTDYPVTTTTGGGYSSVATTTGGGYSSVDHVLGNDSWTQSAIAAIAESQSNLHLLAELMDMHHQHELKQQQRQETAAAAAAAAAGAIHQNSSSSSNNHQQSLSTPNQFNSATVTVLPSIDQIQQSVIPVAPATTAPATSAPAMSAPAAPVSHRATNKTMPPKGNKGKVKVVAKKRAPRNSSSVTATTKGKSSKKTMASSTGVAVTTTPNNTIQTNLGAIVCPDAPVEGATAVDNGDIQVLCLEECGEENYATLVSIDEEFNETENRVRVDIPIQQSAPSTSKQSTAVYTSNADLEKVFADVRNDCLKWAEERDRVNSVQTASAENIGTVVEQQVAAPDGEEVDDEEEEDMKPLYDSDDEIVCHGLLEYHRKIIDLSQTDDDAENVVKVDVENVIKVDAENVSKFDAKNVSKVDAEKVSKVDAKNVSKVDVEKVSKVDAENISKVDAENVVKVNAENDVKSQSLKTTLTVQPKVIAMEIDGNNSKPNPGDGGDADGEQNNGGCGGGDGDAPSGGIQESTPPGGSDGKQPADDGKTDEKTNSELNDEFNMVLQEFDLKDIVSDSRLSMMSDLRSSQVDHTPITSVTQLCWNPNYSSYTWLLVTSHSGIATIHCLSGLAATIDERNATTTDGAAASTTT